MINVLPAATQDYLHTVLPRMEGWCSPEKAIRLAELVLEHRSVCSVDLGVFGAKSTLALALGHKIARHGYVTGVDPWAIDPCLEGTNDLENAEWWKALDLEQIYQGALTAMREAAVSPHWQFLRVTSLEAVDYFRAGQVTLLHQDSNHSEEVSCAELAAWREKMAPGALWIMDDTEWPTLQKVQTIMREECGFTLLEDHQQWRVYQVPA